MWRAITVSAIKQDRIKKRKITTDIDQQKVAVTERGNKG